MSAPPEKKRPFALARLKGNEPLTGLADILAEERRRKEQREQRRTARLARAAARQPPPPPSDEDDFHPESVIISTPAPRAYNNNLRTRRIDALVREQAAYEARKAEQKQAIIVTSPPQHPLSLRADQHPREDSMSLLRRLSRVASASPNPISQDRDETALPIDTKPPPQNTMGSRYPRPQPPRSALEAVVPKFREQREYGEDTIGELENIITSNTQDSPEELEHATAAPRNTTDILPQRITSTHSSLQQPKSALGEVVKEARTEPLADESMIASLENIINPVTEQSNSNLTPAATPLKEEEGLDLERPLTQLEKDRRQERLALESLNKRLQSTRSTIKDANRGLRRIENRIEEVEATNADTTIVKDEATAPKTAKPIDGPALGFQTIIHHKDSTVCSHCGGSSSVWRALWTEFRQNFYAYDNTADNHIHITWLGWTIILWFLWLLLETALSTQYSNYIYGPVFPFVTFNLTVTPFLPILRPLFSFLAWGIGSLFNLLFGEVAASSKSPSTPGGPGVVTTHWGYHGTRTTAFLSGTASRVASSTVEALDELAGMWGDGYTIN